MTPLSSAPPSRASSVFTGLRMLWIGTVLIAGQGTAMAADPTAEQQYWLELINRFRASPQTELDNLVNISSPGVWGTPKSDDPSIANALTFFGTSAADLQAQLSSLSSAPPLAWSSALNVSATTYSNLMTSNDQQAHNLGGFSLAQRIQNGGYSGNWLEVGENLFASTQTIVHGHAGFVIDWGDGNGGAPGFGNGIQSPAGHREVMLDSNLKEVGIGFQSILIPGSNVNAVGPYVTTQHFATQFRFDGSNYFSDAILTGSVYEDTIAADLFYTPGEGLAGVAVNVYDGMTDMLVASGFTNSAGGFNINLAGLTDSAIYWVEAPSTGMTRQSFSLNAHVENDYGAPVTFYDNVYASFAVVPEPGGLLLCLVAALPLLAHRSRRRSAPCP